MDNQQESNREQDEQGTRKDLAQTGENLSHTAKNLRAARNAGAARRTFSAAKAGAKVRGVKLVGLLVNPITWLVIGGILVLTAVVGGIASGFKDQTYDNKFAEANYQNDTPAANNTYVWPGDTNNKAKSKSTDKKGTQEDSSSSSKSSSSQSSTLKNTSLGSAQRVEAAETKSNDSSSDSDSSSSNSSSSSDSGKDKTSGDNGVNSSKQIVTMTKMSRSNKMYYMYYTYMANASYWMASVEMDGEHDPKFEEAYAASTEQGKALLDKIGKNNPSQVVASRLQLSPDMLYLLDSTLHHSDLGENTSQGFSFAEQLTRPVSHDDNWNYKPLYKQRDLSAKDKADYARLEAAYQKRYGSKNGVIPNNDLDRRNDDNSVVYPIAITTDYSTKSVSTTSLQVKSHKYDTDYEPQYETKEINGKKVKVLVGAKTTSSPHALVNEQVDADKSKNSSDMTEGKWDYGMASIFKFAHIPWVHYQNKVTKTPVKDAVGNQVKDSDGNPEYSTTSSWQQISTGYSYVLVGVTSPFGYIDLSEDLNKLIVANKKIAAQGKYDQLSDPTNFDPETTAATSDGTIKTTFPDITKLYEQNQEQSKGKDDDKNDSDSSNSDSNKSKSVNYVAIGDELTSGGKSVNSDDTYPQLFGKALKKNADTKVSVSLQANSANTADSVLKNIDSIIAKKPTLVTVALGTNEMVSNGSKGTSSFKNNLLEIVSKLRAAKIDVVVLGVWAGPAGISTDGKTSLSKIATEYDSIAQDIATSHGSKFVSLQGIYNDKKNHLSGSDPFFANKTGQKLISEAISQTYGDGSSDTAPSTTDNTSSNAKQTQMIFPAKDVHMIGLQYWNDYLTNYQAMVPDYVMQSLDVEKRYEELTRTAGNAKASDKDAAAALKKLIDDNQPISSGGSASSSSGSSSGSGNYGSFGNETGGGIAGTKFVGTGSDVWARIMNLKQYIERYSTIYGFDPYLVAAIMAEETGANLDTLQNDIGHAIQPPAVSGSHPAFGITQVELNGYSSHGKANTRTFTAKNLQSGNTDSFDYSVESTLGNPEAQIKGGIMYLAQGRDWLEQKGWTSPVLLVVYNQGPAFVQNLVAIAKQNGLAADKISYDFALKHWDETLAATNAGGASRFLPTFAQYYGGKKMYFVTSTGKIINDDGTYLQGQGSAIVSETDGSGVFSKLFGWVKQIYDSMAKLTDDGGLWAISDKTTKNAVSIWSTDKVADYKDQPKNEQQSAVDHYSWRTYERKISSDTVHDMASSYLASMLSSLDTKNYGYDDVNDTDYNVGRVINDVYYRTFQQLYTADTAANEGLNEGNSSYGSPIKNKQIKDLLITSSFGWRDLGGYQFHQGYDFGTSGSDINVAVADGTITYVGSPNSAQFNLVIEHTNDGAWVYWQEQASTSVKQGQKVKKGDEIGRPGTHLHFGEFKDGQKYQGTSYPLPGGSSLHLVSDGSSEGTSSTGLDVYVDPGLAFGLSQKQVEWLEENVNGFKYGAVAHKVHNGFQNITLSEAMKH